MSAFALSIGHSVLVFLAASALEEQESEQRALFERVAPSVVYLTTGAAFGSGFFVGPKGLVLTNAHVVAGVEKVSAVLHDGRKLEGTVIERGPEDLDLALVRLPLENAPVLALSGSNDLRVGSWVASVGHGMGGIWTFTTGMVSNIYPAGSERPVFQTQIPLNPGNSGGPIFDRRARVAGVVTAGIREASAINFGIRGDIALQKLGKLGDECACLTVTAPAGVPIFVDGQMAGKGPRLVIAAEPRVYEVFAVVGGAMKKTKARYPDVRRVDLN